MSGYAEPQIARLLSAFRSPPDAWVRAAQELPLVRRGFDDLLRRATDDAAFRRNVIADLERALRAEGAPTYPAVVAALRRRLPTD